MKEELPPLREDLSLTPGPFLEHGAPTWNLHDPVRNRFFRLGHREFSCLTHWHLGQSPLVAQQVSIESPLTITATTVENLRDFLLSHCLLSPAHPEVRRRLQQRCQRPAPGMGESLLHHYLFFRIPLVTPDRFLSATLPLVRCLFTRLSLHLLSGTALLSGYLIMRQWDTFRHTFQEFLGWEGAVWYTTALVIAKLIHEMGHAYTAKYHGLRVPTMGVAFLVMWPVLYTDASEAWRLPDRMARLQIAAAGILTELGIAVIASLWWSILPDGSARSACFVLATVTWVSTLTINLSPFMRFDGYYILSDYLDIPNLQERAFAVGRWQLRRFLLGIDLPDPDAFSPRTRHLLLVYAWATWIYRLVLFTGIALFVYHLFFKLLGIALFLVEIGWFVLRPIATELALWWRLRPMIHWNRRTLTLTIGLAGIIILGLMPWHSQVMFPAVIKAEVEARLFPPFPARLEAVLVTRGQMVKSGDPLLQLAAPSVAFTLRQSTLETLALEEELRRSIGRKQLTDRLRVTESQLDKALTNLQGAEAQMAKLLLTAPIDGRILDLDPGLTAGRWLRESDQLALIADPRSTLIIGYLPEEDLHRVAIGAPGKFIPDQPEGDTIPCQVVEVAPAAARGLPEPYLASLYGGELPVQKGPKEELALRTTVYRVRLLPENHRFPVQILRGRVAVTAEPQSLVQWLWQQIATIIIRESGF